LQETQTDNPATLCIEANVYRTLATESLAFPPSAQYDRSAEGSGAKVKPAIIESSTVELPVIELATVEPATVTLMSRPAATFFSKGLFKSFSRAQK
jgi:hypothetical protein